MKEKHYEIELYRAKGKIWLLNKKNKEILSDHTKQVVTLYETSHCYVTMDLVIRYNQI